jgi:hypothetical protein
LRYRLVPCSNGCPFGCRYHSDQDSSRRWLENWPTQRTTRFPCKPRGLPGPRSADRPEMVGSVNRTRPRRVTLDYSVYLEDAGAKRQCNPQQCCPFPCINDRFEGKSAAEVGVLAAVGHTTAGPRSLEQIRKHIPVKSKVPAFPWHFWEKLDFSDGEILALCEESPRRTPPGDLGKNLLEDSCPGQGRREGPSRRRSGRVSWS